MSQYDVVIEGVFVDPLDGVFDDRIGIANGTITRGVARDSKCDIYNCASKGSYVLPGFIDNHGHFRQCDNNLPDADDYTTGTRAAAHGGVTTVFAMPNTMPLPINTRNAYRMNKSLADSLGVVNVELIGGICAEMVEDKDRLRELAEDAPALKTSTCETTGGIYIQEDAFGKILENIAELGINIPLIVHCENQKMNDAAKESLKTKKYACKHCDERPPESEAHEIKRVLDLCQEYDINVHIAHVSTAEGMKYVRVHMGTRPGKVSAEVTIHHAVLSRYVMEELGPYAKMNPPLRPEGDRSAMQRELLHGDLDIMLVTDHAPHTMLNKEGPSPPSGVPGLDAYGAFVSQSMSSSDDAEIQRIAQVTSFNAAQRFGLKDRGRIADGFRADLVLIDPKNPIKALMLYTKCGWSPYQMVNVGWPEVSGVWLVGEMIADSGKVLV